MKRLLSLVFAFLFLSCSGCAWFGSQGHSFPAPDVINKRIVKAEELRYGGKIVIIPFKPAEDVAFDEMSQKTALKIIEKAAEYFKKQNTGFEVILSDQAAEADFIIEGHIAEMSKPSWWQRWILWKRFSRLAVEAKMVNRFTNQAILTFADKQQNNTMDDFVILGGQVGEDLARVVTVARDTYLKEVK